MSMKKVIGLACAMAVFALLSVECFAQDCSGTRRTPLRNLVAAQPVRTVLKNTAVATKSILQKVSSVSRSQSCSGSAAVSSCNGSVRSSCAGSAHSIIVGSAPVAPSSSNYAIAQHKSDIQASSGVMRHPGGSMGTARYEGVGFSTVSAEDAKQRACYYGQRQLVATAVSRGANGWYATNLYN